MSERVKYQVTIHSYISSCVKSHAVSPILRHAWWHVRLRSVTDTFILSYCSVQTRNGIIHGIVKSDLDTRHKSQPRVASTRAFWFVQFPQLAKIWKFYNREQKAFWVRFWKVKALGGAKVSPWYFLDSISIIPLRYHGEEVLQTSTMCTGSLHIRKTTIMQNKITAATKSSF